VVAQALDKGETNRVVPIDVAKIDPTKFNIVDAYLKWPVFRRCTKIIPSYANAKEISISVRNSRVTCRPRTRCFDTTGTTQALKELELAAKQLAVKLQFLDVLSAKDMETAFGAAGKNRTEAVLVLNSPVFNSPRTQITHLAAQSRLPAIYWATEFVEAGGLSTYSVSFTDLFRRAAAYVDKILKGRKPADLPVEQPKVRVHHQSQSSEADPA